MATHFSTLAWEIPWMEEPDRLQSMGSWRVGHDWVTSLSLFTLMHWRRKWQPTPLFLPGESQGREPGGPPSMGSQSRTQLMWLSSGSSSQVSFGFLLLHCNLLWWKGHLFIFLVLVLKGVVSLHRDSQFQLLWHQWLKHRLGLLWYWMVLFGNESISFCSFFFFLLILFFKLYIIVLVLPNIKMNPPQVRLHPVTAFWFFGWLWRLLQFLLRDSCPL